jgi:hypothetical protein
MSDIQTQFLVTTYDAPGAGRIAVMTMDNGHDHTKPNVFGEGALRSLEAALDELEGRRRQGAAADRQALHLRGRRGHLRVRRHLPGPGP